jgi:hypothetical protein
LYILTNVLTNEGIGPDILTNAWVGEFGPHCKPLPLKIKGP